MLRELSTQEAFDLQEQFDSYIKGDDKNDEDFRVDNVNLRKTSSESSDSNAVEHCVNVIVSVPKSGRSCGHGQTKRRRKKGPNLCDGSSNDKYSSCGSIIWPPINLSYPT